jgi:hypothetical protein
LTIQRDEPRKFGPGMMAVVGAVLLVSIAAAMVYRSVTDASRAKTPRLVVAAAEAARVSPEEAPRAIERAAPTTRPAAPTAATPAATSLPQPESAGMDQPFAEARQEARDSIWALQTESSVRDGMAAIREKNVALESVRCASIRCTLEGTIGRGGDLHEVVRALSKAGLKQGRFKRTRDDQGKTTFSAVFARQGYALDGSPREAVAEAL